MRSYLFYIVSIVLYFSSCQTGLKKDKLIHISNNEQVLYYGISNEIKLIYEGLNCDDYIVKYFEGEIYKDNCIIRIIPLDTNTIFTEFYTFYKGITDTLNEIVLIAPNPKISINGFNNHNKRDKLDFIKIHKQDKINIKHKIKSFNIEYFQNGKSIYQAHNKGYNFTERDRNTILALKPKDKIRLTKIKVLGSDGLIRMLKMEQKIE